LEINTTNIESALQTEPERAFAFIYAQYYETLCNVSYKILFDQIQAEDVVQEVLIELYNKRNQIVINTSLIAYLRKAVYYRTLNALKHNSRFSIDGEDKLLGFENLDKDVEEMMIINEDLKNVNQIIESLPTKCRYVFTLSRYEDKSYAEIAEIMGISVKTVENQVAKALKIVRAYANKLHFFAVGIELLSALFKHI
jgi:RNA polymerase sigma-70 factor, ECF subfamily